MKYCPALLSNKNCYFSTRECDYHVEKNWEDCRDHQFILSNQKRKEAIDKLKTLMDGDGI